jgi:pyruvate dehydrogenase E2 component (dihydrolipoamide acetyltransferase)
MQAVAPQRVKPVGFDAAQMRQAIAAAMSRSKREIPHYYLAETVDFAAAQAWLDHWNRDRLPQDRLLSAVLLLKATALALRDVPQLNGFFENGQFRPGHGIHIGWAIALRGGGLVAPAIHHADQKTLPELMSALRDLVQRARAGGLRSSELTDPTITVSSLGDRGAASVWGVIYPPQVAIVGFGRVLSQPWVVDGQVLPRPVVNASLAADHRASDGHLGGQLLVAIHRALQTPQDL